jgi:transposase InsO family protein
MQDDYHDRHQAVRLRLAGRSIPDICRILGRSERWFHKWWNRYLEFGPDGLFELTRANHQVTQRIPPELERTILTIRRRLEARTRPSSRYQLIGANAIVAELKTLNVRPLPSPRTVDRVLQRHGITLPRVRLARWLPQQEYPGPQAHASNQLHQVDLVGPIYLKGQRRRYYIFVGKDRFDGAVCLRLRAGRRMEDVLAFLGDCWKTLGRPTQVQFDNAREIIGWGPPARYLSRVIRLCLRFGVEPVFIPPREPERNGSVENFNGWFQPRLFERHYTRAGDLRRELARLELAVNTQHVHSQLGGRTAEQHRRRQRLQKLPERYEIPLDRLSVAAGRVTFIRRISSRGTISVLSQSFAVGKRHKGRYARAVLDTQRRRLTVYVDGRVIKRYPYPWLNK